jgi:hypothetical protein
LKIRDNNPDLDFVGIFALIESVLYGLPNILVAEEWKIC